MTGKRQVREGSVSDSEEDNAGTAGFYIFNRPGKQGH